MSAEQLCMFQTVLKTRLFLCVFSRIGPRLILSDERENCVNPDMKAHYHSNVFALFAEF